VLSIARVDEHGEDGNMSNTAAENCTLADSSKSPQQWCIRLPLGLARDVEAYRVEFGEDDDGIDLTRAQAVRRLIKLGLRAERGRRSKP
jgi:hypothetical protein